MKKLSIIFLAMLAIMAFSCTKDIIEDPASDADEDGNRIKYIKSASYSNNEKQQEFDMFFATFETDSTLTILLNYRSSASNNLHDFDFVWDEKLSHVDGKSLMNIDVYHKTNEANATVAVTDTIRLTVSDVLRKKPYWFRLQNTANTNNSLTLKYMGWAPQ